MSAKCISSSLATLGAIALATAPALAESSVSSNPEFSCKVDNGTPVTVLQANNEQTTIFHWNSSQIGSSANATELCNRATENLNNYSAQGNDLSALKFKASEQVGLPTVLATNGDDNAEVVLFTLAPSDKPIEVANNVLSDIINQDLQFDKTEVDRGVQSISYSINIWDLILGPKYLK